MKKIILNLTAILLTLVSTNSFADEFCSQDISEVVIDREAVKNVDLSVFKLKIRIQVIGPLLGILDRLTDDQLQEAFDSKYNVIFNLNNESFDLEDGQALADHLSISCDNGDIITLAMRTPVSRDPGILGFGIMSLREAIRISQDASIDDVQHLEMSVD